MTVLYIGLKDYNNHLELCKLIIDLEEQGVIRVGEDIVTKPEFIHSNGVNEFLNTVGFSGDLRPDANFDKVIAVWDGDCQECWKLLNQFKEEGKEVYVAMLQA